MRTKRYYQVRTVCRYIFWSFLIIAVLSIGMVLMDHINWMGDHYCFKSSLDCYWPKGGK